MSDKQNIIIKGQRIRLRSLCLDDLEMTLNWRNNPDIRKWFFNSKIITKQEHEVFFTNYLLKDNDYIFIIEENINDYRSIGQISIYNIEWNNKTAEIGRLMIGDFSARGRGYAGESLKLLISYVGQKFNIFDLYLNVLTHNQNAIALYTKHGFTITSQNGDNYRMVYKPFCKSVTIDNGD